jgi:hypothetical protein
MRKRKKKTGTLIKKLEQLTMTPQMEYINNIKQMRGNYDEGCKLFVIKVSYHMHFQWVSKSMWKDVVQPFNCQSLLQSKVTLLYVCTFKLNSVHNSKCKHINIKSLTVTFKMLFSDIIIQSTEGGRGGGVVVGSGEVYVCTKWISKATQYFVYSEWWWLPMFPALQKMKQT